MVSSAKLNFVRQQGFENPERGSCGARYPALMFQPRITAVLVLVGLIFQAWPLFLGLSVVLWWNVLVPARNPFDALYNRLIAGPRELPRLSPAPAPRRFAQAMAATFMLATGLFLFLGWHSAAFVVEALLVAALTALIFGKFCLGSYIFYLLRGRAAFANHTLPWAHGV
ncbi:MAG: DUF4395 family protein [Planctomycetota bacterium]